MATVSTPERPPAAGPPPSGATARRRRPDAALLGLLVPVAVLAAAGWELRWVNEDGFIYLRVVDNLLAGHGPVFNLAERVEAYTSPAWLALVAAAGALLPFAQLEWVAVVLGLAAAAGGLLLGGLGARRLLRAAGRTGPVLPLGAAVVAALPPFWDYATSALETGLVLAWLGASFLGLAAVAAREPGRPPRPAAAAALAGLIGLGPLVRPDLALFAAGFLAALVALLRPLPLRRALALVAAAAALPAAYQVFRMGYFAALLPNTALAKEAGLPYWTRGLRYVENFAVPYNLWLPLVPLGWLLWTAARADLRAGRRRLALAAATPAACAALHLVYVVRLGGDYMHGRMLLPTLFAGVLPVAVVALPRRRPRLAAAAAAMVLGWALVVGLAVRAPSDPGPPAPAHTNGGEMIDQRRKQLTAPGHPHPVTLADHDVLPFPQPHVGRSLRRLARPGRTVLVVDYRRETLRPEGRPIPARTAVPLAGVRAAAGVDDPVVAWTGSIGRAGYAAGPAVRIADRLGLADAVGSRIRLGPERRAKAGHEKDLVAGWFLGRFADPASIRRNPRFAGDPSIPAARRALRCGDLGRVIGAIEAPLTAGRFASNIGVAWRTRSLRVPKQPVAAERELCRRR